MHRLIALLLALLLAVGCTAALAESGGVSVKTDKIPEGYTCEYEVTEEGGLQALFLSGNEAAPVILLGIGLLDEDYSLDRELTAEELNAIEEAMRTEYADPQATQQVAGNGTRIVIVQEKADPCYADIFTAWQGWSIQVGLLKAEALTEADLALAIEVITTAWNIEL